MAILGVVAKKNKRLEQVANTIKNVALFYAPKKTGNLKRRINQVNKPAKMIKILAGKRKQKIAIALDIDPPGAEYGKWFNDPPKVVKRTALKRTAERKGNWNFGNKAMEDKAVRDEFDKYFAEFSKDIVKAVVDEFKF